MTISGHVQDLACLENMSINSERVGKGRRGLRHVVDDDTLLALYNPFSKQKRNFNPGTRRLK
jgi:hypothetical protein